jgi:hypothetical protein
MKLKDFNGKEIKEGDVLTFDWFDNENPVSNMRKMFTSVHDWTYEQIRDRIHEPTFIVKINEKGRMHGEGLKKLNRINDAKLYLHHFRFKYTKVLANEEI